MTPFVDPVSMAPAFVAQQMATLNNTDREVIDTTHIFVFSQQPLHVVRHILGNFTR